MDQSGDRLTELSSSQTIVGYLRELWSRREFAVVVPAFDVRIQNMDSALGQVWHLINPMLIVSIYYLIFGVVLDIQRGEDYLGFLVIGVLLFQLTQRIVQDAALIVRRNEALIRTVQFPRGLLPISAVTGQTFAFLPTIGVLFCFLLITGIWPTTTWLLFLPILLAQVVISAGLAFVSARIGFTIADLAQILPHLFRILFYLSGVLFAVDDFVSNDTIRNLFAINPLYDIITVARWSLMGTNLPPAALIGFLAWVVLLPPVGLFFFRAGETRYGS